MIDISTRSPFYSVEHEVFSRRDAPLRVIAIESGAEEVMRDPAARQLGFHSAGYSR